MACFLLLLFFAIAPVLSVVPADEVTSLPGWAATLPSKQYSGYLNISGGKHLHYWLVYSERAPDTDPLVFWFNGGPGCSSLDGYFYEQGPFHVVEPYPTNSVPDLYYNNYTWAKVANMVFLEAPACVGFSYSDSASGCQNNDQQQAKDNFEALQSFYKSYPEYASRDLFITGESYAGMYVPTLALQILAYNNQSGITPIPLKGIAVGNGVIGQKTGEPSEQLQVEFLYGHGLFADVVYKQILADCGNFSTPYSPACEADLTKMSQEVGYVNVYDIYEPCVNSGAAHLKEFSKRPMNYWERRMRELGIVGGPVECIDGGAAQAYLDQPTVRQAIHVPPVSQIGNWEICGNKLIYTENWGSLLPNYKNQIIPFIRVLIYNGDVDACVPYNGNEWWTSSLNFSTTSAWTQWEVDGQNAGYLTKYVDNFQFITIKGAGHMVPEYKPQQALSFFSQWLNNKCC